MLKKIKLAQRYLSCMPPTIYTNHRYFNLHM
jgi:hypothetical protein